jgi:hypothetical protein
MGNFMTRDSRAILVPSPIARLSPLVSLLLRFSDIGRAVAISASGKNYRAAAPQDAKKNRAKRKGEEGARQRPHLRRRESCNLAVATAVKENSSACNDCV